MNKSLLTFLLLILAFAIPGYAQEEIPIYSIEFVSGTNTGTNWDTYTKSSKVSTASEEYISSVTGTKAYPATANNLQIGSGSAAGSLTITLSDAGKIDASKVIFYAKKYNTKDSGKATVTIGTATSTFTPSSTTAAAYVLELEVGDPIETIEIETDKRVCFEKIEVYELTPVTGPAKPTFEPAAGTYTGTQNVTITCATDGAILKYSFDGTTWNEYPETGTGIEVTSSCTLYAKATDSKGETSEASAAYTIIEPITSIAKLVETLGIPATGASTETATVDFNAVVFYCYGKYTYIYDGENCALLYTNGSNLYSKGDVLGAGWEVKITNYYNLIEFVPATDPATTTEVSMELPSVTEITPEQITTEKQALYVKLSDVVFSTATASTNVSFTGTVNGETINFYNRFVLESVPAGTYDVYGVVSQNNSTMQIFPIEYVDNKVATPAISFDAATNTVTITCATEGAAVEYSLNGENYQPYSEPFVIEQSCTVSARATKDGMNDSSVATLDCTWTDLNAVAAPTFSLEEGEYLYGTELTISTAEGCTLTVMIDEYEIFEENIASGSYTIHLTKEATVTAYASKDGHNSDEVEMTYLVRDPKAATATIADGEVIEGKSVSFTWEEVPGFTYKVTDENETVLATGNADEAYTFDILGTVLVTLSGEVYDKTFTQSFIYEVVEKPADEYYVLVTDANQLQDGDLIVVAGAKDGAYYAMTNTKSTGKNPKIQGIDVSKSVTDNYLKLEPEQEEVGIFTLVETEGKYAISGSKGYVSFNAGSSNNTDFSETAVNYILTSDDDNVVKFETYSGSNDRWLRLFVSDAKAADFRAYLNNSGEALVIFKKSLGKKANIAIEFAGDEECGYLEDDVMFTYEGVPADATVNTVVKDAEGNEVADIEADNSGVYFTASTAHTYTVTASVVADFTYAPATFTSAPVHVLPVVEFNPQEDYQVGVTDNQIVVMPGGTNYTISSYSHPNLSLYYKKVASQAQPSPNAEDANAGYTKYADEPIFLENGNELTYYFGNEAGDKFGLTTLKAVLPTGIEGIEVSADDNAEYYNLQGVRVSADNLTSGLYIRLQGNTATKVMVKQAR